MGEEKPITIQNTSSRILYLDCLRILAAFGVIMIHVSSQNWEAVDIRSWDRRIFALYNNAMSWPVSVFVMLSGVLFLDNDRPIRIRQLYTKNIFRLVIAFLFWSGIYALNDYFNGSDLNYVSNIFFQGHVHLWYLFLAISYYISVPVLRQITLTRRTTEYFLVITWVWSLLLPTAVTLLQYMKLPMTDLLTNSLAYWKETVQFPFYGLYLFYFVLGFYLHKYDASPRCQKLLPFLALLGYAVRVILCDHYVQVTGTGDIPFKFHVFDFPVAAAVFLFGRNVLSKWKPNGIVLTGTKLVSDCSLGIYLVHMLVMYKLKDWTGLNTLSFQPVWSVPVVTLTVMLISLGISWLLRKIPILKKYVV